MARRVTARDVATLAGVSRSAVSMVLNGRGDGDVSPENQAAIRNAAAQLNYRPNNAARSLRNDASQTLGVITDSVASGTYGGAMIAAAARVAAERGYLLLVVDSQRDHAVDREAVTLLQSRQCDALMFVAESLVAWQPPVGFQDDPCVLVNAFDTEGGVPGIYGDEVAGGRAAAELALARGHRDIVFLHGTPDLVADHRRVQGHVAALQEAGVSPRLVSCGWEIDRGLAAAGQVLDADPPTAIVCANDRVAAGVYLAAARRGLRIPQDLSVVGYDDDPQVASQLGISTIRIPFSEMGEVATRTLLDGLAGQPVTSGDVVLPSVPVERGSVAAPRR